jgi:5,10-methylenetetrahydrofolate reductase
VKIPAGIVLLTSARMATYMNEHVAGIFVPENLVSELASTPKGGALNKGVEIAGRMIRKIKEEGIANGVHIMAIGKETVVPDILQAANL